MTELGEIPHEWEVNNGFIKIKSGFGFKLREYELEGIPLIRINNVMYGEIMENLQKFAENEAKYMVLFKRDYYGDYEKIEDEILKYNLKVLTRNEEGMILEKN